MVVKLPWILLSMIRLCAAGNDTHTSGYSSGCLQWRSFLALFVIHACTISLLVAHSGIHYHYMGILGDGGVAIIVEKAAGVGPFGLASWSRQVSWSRSWSVFIGAVFLTISLITSPNIILLHIIVLCASATLWICIVPTSPMLLLLGRCEDVLMIFLARLPRLLRHVPSCHRLQ